MATLKGNLLTPRGLVHGSMTFTNFIEAVDATSEVKDDIYILPGFIDTHVHGGGGGDTMDGSEGVYTLAKFHLQHGTTTLYPTTMTNPWANITKALQGVQEVMQEPSDNLPDIPGVHLEGPFISPKRLGAPPPFTLEPTQDLLEELLSFNVIRLVTIAPEVSNALVAAHRFINANARISIGHTLATFEQVQTFMQLAKSMNGVLGFTHLYNAMGGLSGREPGVVGAALADKASFAELILDTHHVHPASFLAALNAKSEQLFFVTDAIRAAGLPDGKTELGGQEVTVKEGRAVLVDGTLAGSVLTLDKALRNALETGLTLGQASKLLSAIPARYMGLEDRGRLTEGGRADLVVLSKEMKVLEVYLAGRRCVG